MERSTGCLIAALIGPVLFVIVGIITAIVGPPDRQEPTDVVTEPIQAVEERRAQEYSSVEANTDESSEPTSTESVETQEEPQPEVVQEPTPEPEPEPGPSETISQKNAVRSAKSYLNYTAFSYTGLIEQLEYEQFSHTDAVYGADNSGADWFEQAAKSAESYLDYTSFSRGGLIDQLKYEGFTQEQAEYGVNAVGL